MFRAHRANARCGGATHTPTRRSMHRLHGTRSPGKHDSSPVPSTACVLACAAESTWREGIVVFGNVLAGNDHVPGEHRRGPCRSAQTAVFLGFHAIERRV